MSEHVQFPTCYDVDVSILARLFDEHTNSYKYLFFLAILDRLERTNFEASTPLILDELIIDMLVLAWYPHVYFRLSFGKQDRVTRELESISTDSVHLSALRKVTERDTVRHMIAERFDAHDLARYVPYRLIRPFFARETRQLKDSVVNGRVAELSAQYFPDARTLYKFDDACRSIELQPLWCDYLRRNISIIKGWARWKWLQYMQSANPMVPNIGLKLFPPLERQSLKKQTDYWKLVIDRCALPCIYTGQTLRVDEFALDHFLPWSFIVSDSLWNLVPVSPRANSAKSDKLPDKKYFCALIETQHTGLQLTHAAMPNDDWIGYVRSFLADLKMTDNAELLDRSKLRHAYEAHLPPLLALATANGFESDWTYSVSKA